MVPNALYSTRTKILRNDGGGGKDDPQHHEVEWKPDVKPDGNGGEVFVAESCSHDGIHNAGTHLCRLRNQQRPADSPKLT